MSNQPDQIQELDHAARYRLPALRPHSPGGAVDGPILGYRLDDIKGVEPTLVLDFCDRPLWLAVDDVQPFIARSRRCA